MEQLIPLMYLDVPIRDGGPIYPSAVIGKAIHEFEERVKEKSGVLGECGVPFLEGLTETEVSQRIASIDATRVSHIVRHVWAENGVLQCKVQLMGHYAEMTEAMDLEWSAVPRAVGEIGEDQVCTKYTLITVDLIVPELI